MQQVSDNGKLLIKSFESCRLESYQDEAGVWTIGWGHTPATSGQTVSQQTADAWFDQDVSVAVGAVNQLVRVSINQNQFDALVSFTFNLGSKRLANSTLLSLLNAGHALDAAAEFVRWIHAGQNISKGLYIRRMKEALCFLQ